jgi:putative transposase
LIERKNRRIAIIRQCMLIGLVRSSYYYRKTDKWNKDFEIMRLIDEQYTKTPFYGIKKMGIALRRLGQIVNHKRIARLMRLMGLCAIYPKPNLSKPSSDHKKYPYLLKGLSIVKPNQVWSTDITYIRLRHGFVYLAAIMDWFSRYVVSWALSITLDTEFCVDMLAKALHTVQPEIFNSDQGSQFTSCAFTGILEKQRILISMDGRGRAYDNIFLERLWRTVKYEEVYLKEYAGVRDAKDNLWRYFDFYNYNRPHQSLRYKTPAEVYFAGNNLNNFMGGEYLIASSVQITNAVL